MGFNQKYKIGIHVIGGASIGAGKSILAQRLNTAINGVGIHSAVVPFALELKNTVYEASSLDVETRAAWLYTRLLEWGFNEGNGYTRGIVALAAQGASNAIQTYWNDADPKQRRVLQEVAQMWRDTVDRGIWVDRWFANHPRDADVIVADDVRYDNEAMACNLLIGIDARGIERTQDAHESERGITFLPDLAISARADNAEFVRLALRVLEYVGDWKVV